MFKKYTILELQWGGDGQDKNTVKSRFNTDSEGAIESVHINGVSVLSGFYFPPEGQSKLAVIMRCRIKRASV